MRPSPRRRAAGNSGCGGCARKPQPVRPTAQGAGVGASRPRAAPHPSQPPRVPMRRKQGNSVDGGERDTCGSGPTRGGGALRPREHHPRRPRPRPAPGSPPGRGRGTRTGAGDPVPDPHPAQSRTSPSPSPAAAARAMGSDGRMDGQGRGRGLGHAAGGAASAQATPRPRPSRKWRLAALPLPAGALPGGRSYSSPRPSGPWPRPLPRQRPPGAPFS